MKKLCWFIALITSLLFIVTGCGNSKDKKSDLSKSVTITVVHGDGSSKEFTVKSDSEFLGKAFESKKVFSGTKGQYGLFITTADGEKADNSKQEWWCLTKGGQNVSTGIDSTPFNDGDKFELTLKKGYN